MVALWYPAMFVVCGAIAAIILGAKGHDWWLGLLLGLFGPFGILVAALVKSDGGGSSRLPPPPTGAQWAPDPTRRHELRLWDGRAWTGHVSDRGASGWDPLP